MHLSKRIQRVADNVLSGGVVADIGCDHGFTSIYLIRHKKVTKAIAMDINEGPLERAKEHMLSYGVEEHMELRLSDGLQMLDADEADTLLISGMGGALICQILEAKEEVTKSAKELVLSPQSEIFLVRKCLHGMGFCIAHEEMLLDQGKYYVVIRAVKAKEKEKEQYQREEDYIYGHCLIEDKDPFFIGFLKKEEKRVRRILEGMAQKTLSANAMKQYAGLKKELEQIHTVQQRIKKD